MTLDEAIKHCEEVAERYQRMEDSHDEKLKEECLQCAEDHKQLADWLKELRDARELLCETQPVLKAAFFVNYKDTNAANELYDKIKAVVGGEY